jgi:hypothetical protein
MSSTLLKVSFLCTGTENNYVYKGPHYVNYASRFGGLPAFHVCTQKFIYNITEQQIFMATIPVVM